MIVIASATTGILAILGNRHGKRRARMVRNINSNERIPPAAFTTSREEQDENQQPLDERNNVDVMTGPVEVSLPTGAQWQTKLE
jgi:hypothetical protein